MMATPCPSGRPPWWYWAVSVLALLWMLFGVAAWCLDLTMTPAKLAQYSQGQQQLYAMRPQWLFAVYAVAVFSGLGGAIGLLLRKRWTTTLLLLSLAAIVLQFGYTFVAMDAMAVLGAGEALPLPIVIFLFGLFSLWFARYARRHGWIPGRAEGALA